jgi:hypothetical protein
MNPAQVNKMFPALRAELTKNQRLRVGLVCILLILWAYYLLGTREQVELARAAYIKQASENQRQLSHLKERAWPERASAIAARLKIEEQRFWQGTEIDLQLAAWQDWLNRQLAELKVEQAKVEVVEVEQASGVAEWQPMRAKIGFNYNSSAVQALLQRFEESDKIVQVEALSLKKGARVELSVQAFVLLPHPDAVPK